MKKTLLATGLTSIHNLNKLNNSKMIKRLSEASKESQELFNEYFNNVMLTGVMGYKLLLPFDEFDENGLKFPLDYLKTAAPAIIFLPLELMADYADGITVLAVRSRDQAFINKLMNDLENFPSDLQTINATTIGNLAYITLHLNQATYVTQETEKKLTEIFEFYKQITLDYLQDNV